jgi:1-deoxy-D-xylulose-5-phosphate synthase
MSNNLLSNINCPSDLRLLEEVKLPQLAQELREFIIDIVSVKEGHLGASLGVIELTIALHYIFDTPNDLLVSACNQVKCSSTWLNIQSKNASPCLSAASQY